MNGLAPRLGVLLLVATAGLVTARIDRSGSGMSDVWEVAHGSGLPPATDSDGDGFTNRDEALAGTDPHDADSFPAASGITRLDQSSLDIRFPTVAGVRYQVEVTANLTNWYPAAPAIIGDGSVHESILTLDGEAVATELEASVWTGLTGYGVGVIKTYVASSSPPPTATLTLDALDVPRSNPDLEQFGIFIRGWLIPPETGDYRFWIASDDGSELWVSTNAETANLALVAEVPGWTSYREWDKYPEQHSAAVPLTAGERATFEVYQRESWGGDHLTVAWTRPGMATNTRDIIGVPHLSSVGVSLSELEEEGPLSFRLRVSEADTDADGVTDYEEHMLGLNASVATTTPRINDYDAALDILDGTNAVTAGATTPRAYEAGSIPGQITVFRSGAINPFTVAYTVSGTAVAGLDYQPLTGTVAFAAGAREAVINVVPLTDGLVETAETVTVTLTPGAGYEVGTPASASVTIDDAEDVLFVARLAPAPGLLSGGSGIASVRRTGNALSGKVSLSFGGLRGVQLGSELLVSSNGLTGTTVLDLPTNQVPTLPWTFDPTNGLTREAILAALDGETLWVRIRSEAHPGGELIGRLVQAPGWQTMPPPPAPPPAPTAPANHDDAARFLAQATFGPTPAELTAMTGTTYAAWIDQQLALPPTLHRPFLDARRAELQARDGNDGWQRPRHEAWWQHALAAPDQLRQRMAFALSQILVISQEGGALDGEHVGVTSYYDLLVDHAFGNYRDLIEDVTLSPMMGAYLSMIRNRKPDPVTGHEPDENYAREIMQLFTVGLTELHPDGSLKLDGEGLPVPTYTQEDTVGLAHIFTGWGPHYDPTNPPTWSDGSVANPDSWFLYGDDSLRPMSFYGIYHDTQDRVILRDTLIPGSTNGIDRLHQALDTLFQHPNVGPFLARQLIMRFVTSNPSPGYIHRVAQAFDDNGAGVRGDLGAVIRAVLLDPEARDPALADGVGWGKPMEPVLRMTRILRAFLPEAPFAAQGDNRYFLSYQYGLREQAPLNSPSVFNFFQPVYRQPGSIDQAGLYSPEFQIFAETTAINQANHLFGMINWGVWTPEPLTTNDNVVIRLDLEDEIAILDDPGYASPEEAQAALLDHLDTLLLHGTMSAGLRSDIETAWADLPTWYDERYDHQKDRVQLALYLIATSPEMFVQQ